MQSVIISPVQLYNWLQDPACSKIIVDVRTPDLFDIGYIKTSVYHYKQLDISLVK